MCNYRYKDTYAHRYRQRKRGFKNPFRSQNLKRIDQINEIKTLNKNKLAKFQFRSTHFLRNQTETSHTKYTVYRSVIIGVNLGKHKYIQREALKNPFFRQNLKRIDQTKSNQISKQQ